MSPVEPKMTKPVDHSRKINLIIIHCSASDNPNHDNIEEIRSWHVNQRGWRDVGYHYFIRKNGRVERGRGEDEIGAHCKGYNRNSLGICLSGRSKFTEQQFLSAAKLVKELLEKYGLEYKDVLPHNNFTDRKTCPNFEVEEIIKRIHS